MADEDKTKLRLEIGHVLFIDVVGYSKLLVKQQSELLSELNEVVSGTNEFREADSAGKLIRLPTGDGMALVFRTDPEAPAQCAMEIAHALKSHPAVQLRMGIHSGPVSEMADVNQRQNIAGAGINLAQRVMDCGDAGHILVSKRVAEDLEQHDRWRPFLHELGTCEVKHGVRIDISNLYSDEIGNPQLPKKLQAVRKHRAHVRWAEVAIGLLVLGAIVAAFMIVSRTPTTSLTAIPEKSIAVLPFVDMSEDKANEYFSDGISEELLNLLAKIPQLQVTARTSSFSFKGKEVAIPEIARTLHVAHVLEGSVRKAGNSVRITAQLIKAGTDTHLWSQTYDRKLDDIFKVQDEIAAAVVEQLKIKLLGAAPTAKPVDGQAYALFLQARAVERQGSAEAFAQAIALYQQAVALDASDAAAWTGLAEVYCLQEYQYQRPAEEATRLAREALDRALASDPAYAPAHAQLGWIAIFLERDLAAAARHLEHALTLDPGNTDVLGIAAILARRLGRFEQAVAIGRHLLSHDPVSPTGWDDLGYALLYGGHREEAMAAFRKVLQLSPNFAGEHWNISALLAQDGDVQGAMADAQQESDPQFRLYALTAAHFALGEKAKSDTLFAEAIERYGATSAYSIGLLAALRGEIDLSFEWLEKALQHGEPDLGAIP